MITTGSVRGKCDALHDLAGRALALPAAVHGLGRLAAVGAVPVTPAPFEHLLGGGQDRRVRGRNLERDGAQVLELAQTLQRPVAGVGRTLQVDGEYGGVLPQAHEQQPLGPAGQFADHLRRQIGDLHAAIF